MLPHLTHLVTRLSNTHDFESAGDCLLTAMREVLGATLHQHRLETETAVLRGTIHYRPNDTYRRLWSREFGTAKLEMSALQQPSLTALRWVTRRRCPVSIDVNARLLSVFEGGAPRLLHDDSLAPPLNPNETCRRLHERNVNRLLAFAIRMPNNLTDGMVCIELRCSSEVGDRLATSVGDTLQLMVDLAAPYLTALPMAKNTTRQTVDEYLPVIGNETAGLVELLNVFSALDETILLVGPTGVGKSRFARYCHAHSPRAERPFVTVDLTTCPENLQMAQLVGWRKGAFTGAEKDTPGAIQRAEGGTLFLDEIDKLSLKEQAGLLRLLEERVYRPVGDAGEDRRADVRFIVGTNADLRAAMKAGRFREDLYYRIAVLNIRIPSLRERADEVPAWSDFMLKRCATGNAPEGTDMGNCVRLLPDAAEILCAQEWPGNLRQLDNVIRRAYAYSLLEYGREARPAVVSRIHVERAVQEDLTELSGTESGSGLIRYMRIAARAFAREVKRRAGTSAPLGLEWADAFRGFVLQATIKRFRSKEEALQALGLEKVVQDRNHGRTIKRENESVDRFVRLIEGRSSAPSSPAPLALCSDTNALARTRERRSLTSTSED